MMVRPPAALALFAVVPLAAQRVNVYSEFVRFDSAGNPTAPAAPREILSPAIVRGGFTSFEIVIQVEKGTHYTLYIGQDPEQAVEVKLSRRIGDRLEPIEKTPYESDQSQILWMDVFAAADAPVRRVKIEPQLLVNDDWVVYPMEARVMAAVVPEEIRLSPEWLSPVEVMRSFLCKKRAEEVVFTDRATIFAMQYRNARQDIALAKTSINAREDLPRIFGSCDATPPADPEWYLRIRDYVFKLH